MYMKVSDKMKFEFRAELPMLCRSKGDHSNNFLYPATLKSAGYYVIPSVQKFAFECPSVRPYVRPSVRTSVRQRFVSALYLEHFLTDFLQTLYKILGRSGLGL